MPFFDSWDTTPLTPDQASSWLAVARRKIPIDADEFERLWSLAPSQKSTGIVFGRSVTFPRRTAAFGRDYTFSGQTSVSLDLTDAPGYEHYADWMTDTGLNGVLVNWYDAFEGDYIGAHSDNEVQLVRGAPIVSITFASNDLHFRRFRLKAKKPLDDNGDVAVELRNGDVVVMGGACQQTHKHEIMPPRQREAHERTGRRINVTLRRFV